MFATSSVGHSARRYAPRARPLTLFATLALLASTLIAQPVASAQTDFIDEPVISGLAATTSMDWLPDGRALIGTKFGRITLANPAAGTSSTYMTLTLESTGERGLLDILVDPNSSHFYAYYSSELVNGKTYLTIEKFPFTGNGSADKANGEILWQNPGPTHDEYGQYHIGGSLNIGPDGKFYLTVGDGFEGDNSQDLTNVFGKVLRINTDGSVPVDNPTFDGNPNNIGEIWAYGLRNPFRAAFDDVTGTFYIGDVGGNIANTAYEEINIGLPGKNYGWSLCQGPLGQPKVGPDCPANPATEPPIHYYAHDPGDGCCQNASVTGGEVFRSTELPSNLWGAYIYGDYAQNELRVITFNPDGSVATEGQLIDLGEQQPVWIDQGPDGHIYYLDFVYGGSSSELRRVRYTGSLEQPPTITEASATPLVGEAPLEVQFTGSATDPNGDTISYLWTFGDGTSSSSPNPLHSYATSGTYIARLSATANGDTTFSDPIEIRVGEAPVVTITSPLPTDIFNAGDQLALTATAIDDGPAGELTYEWTLLQAHDQHTHPRLQGLTGSSVTYDIPRSGHDYNGDTSIIVQVRVTDGDGLETLAEVEIEPNKRAIQIETADPVVTTVQVDGITQSLPFVLDTVTGFNHSVGAVERPCGSTNPRIWSSWSNGETQTYSFQAPAADETVTASYTEPNCDVTIIPGGLFIDEGDTGTTVATIPVNLSAPSPLPVTVDWGTAGIGAVADVDFVSASGSLTFPPGVTTQNIAISIIGDTETEDTEFAVALFGNPTNARIGGFFGLGIAVIVDDDAPAAGPVLSVNDAAKFERDSGYAHIGLTVSMSEASDDPITFDWSSFDGSATAGVDYVSRTGTFTFAPGVTSKTFYFRYYGDTTVEADETFQLVIGDTIGATVAGPGYGTATLLNDD